jgi:hypothetical protein
MLFNGGGWQLANREHLLRIGIEEKFIAPDGLLRRGDLILAFMPKELYEEKEKHHFNLRQLYYDVCCKDSYIQKKFAF